MEAGSLRGVATAVGPLSPSWVPARSAVLFLAQALDIPSQSPAPEAFLGAALTVGTSNGEGTEGKGTDPGPTVGLHPRRSSHS